jgi:hypothetical protein
MFHAQFVSAASGELQKLGSAGKMLVSDLGARDSSRREHQEVA